jgi:hypothetical protein
MNVRESPQRRLADEKARALRFLAFSFLPNLLFYGPLTVEITSAGKTTTAKIE